MVSKQAQTYLDNLEKIVLEVIRPAAVEIDQTGAFPRAAMDALSKGGLLGLISVEEIGGMGQGLRVAGAGASGLGWRGTCVRGAGAVSW